MHLCIKSVSCLTLNIHNYVHNIKKKKGHFSQCACHLEYKGEDLFYNMVSPKYA